MPRATPMLVVLTAAMTAGAVVDGVGMFRTVLAGAVVDASAFGPDGTAPLQPSAASKKTPVHSPLRRA
jgi:hypothetical protein